MADFRARFFDELTVRELYEIVRARCEIFLLEQSIVCRDFDGIDYDSLHCFLVEEDGRVVGYLRAFLTETGEVQIGRVLSLTHGIGIGGRLMREALPAIRERLGGRRIMLHSQKHAEGFYKKLGFVTVSEVFLEEGIPHVTMELEGGIV